MGKNQRRKWWIRLVINNKSESSGSGWEKKKLRPIYSSSNMEQMELAHSSPSSSPTQTAENISDKPVEQFVIDDLQDQEPVALVPMLPHNVSSCSSSEEGAFKKKYLQHFCSEELTSLWQPHCFVKTNKSKEFVGCTSMSEAFQQLNLARVCAGALLFSHR